MRVWRGISKLVFQVVSSENAGSFIFNTVCELIFLEQQGKMFNIAVLGFGAWYKKLAPN